MSKNHYGSVKRSVSKLSSSYINNRHTRERQVKNNKSPSINYDIPLSISQNFLTSSRTINKLLNLTDINAKDHIVEIGAGKGHITKQLAKRCGCVTAIEIDERLYRAACEKLGSFSGVKMIHGDFLTYKLNARVPYKVFSNIPFSITTDIIKKLTESRNPPQDAWLVIEKGAAKRFMGTSNESRQSLLLKPFFELKVIHHFNRNDFHPMPSTDAVLLHIKKKSECDIDLADRRYYSFFLDKCFDPKSVASNCGQMNGLTSLLSKRQIQTAVKLAGLPPIKATGTILYVQWLCLFRCFLKMNFKNGGTKFF